MNYRNEFLNTVFSDDKPSEVVAVFKNGEKVTYTTRILSMLKTDKDVDYVYDKETAEILYDSSPW